MIFLLLWKLRANEILFLYRVIALILTLNLFPSFSLEVKFSDKISVYIVMRAMCPARFILLNFMYSIEIETKIYEAYLFMVFYILLATFRTRDILSC